jgi:hypothetical protein
MHYFAPKYGVSINSYTICDLTDIIQLQEIYLNLANPTLKVDFVDANRFGENVTRENMFIISNYCFSEISSEFQSNYIQKLFPKVEHGFMVWNFIPIYNFGFTTHVTPEVPDTGGDNINKYVYF